QPRLLPFLVYLLFLQAMALVLCWWRAKPKWWVLRGLSLASTALWMLFVTVDAPHPSLSNFGIGLFAILFAAAYQAELVLTTLRVSRAPRGPVGPGAPGESDELVRPLGPL